MTIRNTMSTLMIAGAFSALLIVGGCKNEKTSATPAATPVVASAPVNKVCVVNNDDEVTPGLTAQWKSQTVGFCCEHCVAKWNKMTDAQKDAAVTKAVKLSAGH